MGDSSFLDSGRISVSDDDAGPKHFNDSTSHGLDGSDVSFYVLLSISCLFTLIFF